MGAWRTAILFIVIVTSVAGLSCSPCEDHECSKPPPCKGDIVKDACGCCDVCAKVEGERCGGPWKISGVCSSGLFCDKDQDDFNAVGVCKPKASLCGANSHFSACGGMCRPTCDNPTPICPAVCFPGCACDEGFVWSKDNCIPQKICPKKCPTGSHWSMCGSDCPPSCKEPVRACNKMCVPSCVCDVWDHVWRGDRCVPLKQCQDEGCEYNGRKYKEGDSWGDEDETGKNCFCREGRPQCLFVDCFHPSSRHVKTKDGTWDCQKIETGQCPEGYIKPKSSKEMFFCYRFDRKRLSYHDAESSCRADGGRLVTIRDYRTELWIAIRTVLLIRQSTWIGLDDRETDRRLVWSDGVPYNRIKDYEHWDRRVLNTKNNDCAYMCRPRKYRWRLGWCKAKRPYICEYDPFAVTAIRAYQDF
ncbi:FCGBP [Branchiostoma lanceolatum]|uniref:FCGBP protein n=1 Tax=Branchiostoma lanceolatum TaxID=7740 RepID=A0A8J9ZNU5_BRALA|nr:FCGBP [Branchiostoma lanceolatum]